MGGMSGTGRNDIAGIQLAQVRRHPALCDRIARAASNTLKSRT